MAKGDSRCIRTTNDQGLSRTIVVSGKKWQRHKMKHGIRESTPINTKKQSGRRKKNPSRSPNQDMTFTGRPRQINPKNWREQQKVFTKKGAGKVGHHRNKTKEERYRKKIKHHDQDRWRKGKRGREDRYNIAERLLSKVRVLTGTDEKKKGEYK